MKKKTMVIKNESDYQVALARISALMDSPRFSKGEHELDDLSYIVQEYEEKHFPIEETSPITIEEELDRR